MTRRIAVAVAAVCAFAGSAAAQDAQLAQRGEKLYAEQRCSMCHSVNGKGNTKGPLDDAGRLDEETLRQWLINPRVMTEKTKAPRKPIMPAYTKLEKTDIDALVAYMKTLKKN